MEMFVERDFPGAYFGGESARGPCRAGESESVWHRLGSTNNGTV
jgi:hypothetical protein